MSDPNLTGLIVAMHLTIKGRPQTEEPRGDQL